MRISLAMVKLIATLVIVVFGSFLLTRVILVILQPNRIDYDFINAVGVDFILTAGAFYVRFLILGGKG